VLGVAQFGFSAFSAPLVGTVPPAFGVPPMATVIVVCLALAFSVQLVARIRLPRRQVAESPSVVVPVRSADDTGCEPACRAVG